MAECMFDNPIFTDDEAARAYLESLQWPDGVVCPHCGCVGNSTRLQGVKHRAGLYKCNDCRKQFTVTVGTVFEKSKVPLRKWMLATHLMCASKKGMSAHQLHRMLGVTYKTAWFMTHRIREAMNENTIPRIGGKDEIVEVDETYWGKSSLEAPDRGIHSKNKIVSLVERGGEVRSFHVRLVNSVTLKTIMHEQIRRGTRIMTDEAKYYSWVGAGRHFGGHYTTNHSEGEYSRGMIHSSSVEGFFSIVKRGLVGTFHQVGENHLHRYLDEFDFRFNTRDFTDAERRDIALKQIHGKPLYYAN